VSRDLTPHSLQAERSVLGGMLIDPEHVETARALVGAEDFFRLAHQTVYEAILALIDRKARPDLVTLTDALQQAGSLEDVGGAAYIASLVDGVPFSVNVPHYARVVKEHALRRQLIEAAKQLEHAAHQTDATVEELIDAAEGQLTTIGSQQTSDLAGGATLASEATKWLEDVAERRSRGRMSGLTTGIRELDAMTDGLQPGELTVIGARPSQGKTALALQIAIGCEAPCAFFSLEMKRAQLSARALALLARVDGWALRTGRLLHEEYLRVSQALTALSESGLAIDDAADLSIWQIRSKARRWQSQHGLSLVVVDYLQLVTPSRDRRKQSTREQEVATMSRAFKGLAKDLNVPVIVLAQLNRQVEARAEAAPKLSDLRESGAVEQDADLVILLHRPSGKSVKDEGEAHLIIAKQRNGPTGVVETWWVPSQTRFGPMPLHEASA
jgi:replicative DNA helicase